MSKSTPLTQSARHQRGVYALEWAIIFPAFFMLLYAIVSFGLAFLVRESMQYAAEDGVRAALRYQDDRAKRLVEAQKVVVEKLDWLPTLLKPTPSSIYVTICQVGDPDNCSPSMNCGIRVTERCMVHLNFTIPYGTAPLAPGLRMFGISLLNPDQLTASASILTDQGGI